MIIKSKQTEKLIKFLIHNVQGMSFGNAQKSIRLGKIKVNGKKIKENITINIGDEIEIFEYKKSTPQVEIIYIDDNILIVNKPAGIECATRDKSSNNTYSLEEIFQSYNAIVVHRLDRLTEGLVILARSKAIARKFEYYFKNRMIDKFYMAGVYQTPVNTGIKKAYLKKNARTALMDISDTLKDGYKEIITEFNVINNFATYSVLDIKLHTGRTHQIRAHLSHLGHGIINDSKYNKNLKSPSNLYNGYYLTAYKIKFHINDELSYLNNLKIEISPTWLKYVN